MDIHSNRAVVEGAVLVVHGGAGTILPENLTPELERACHQGLRAALEAGYSLWKQGADSVTIVEAAVRILEDDPHFNAGKGAVFTHEGTIELDAALMRGEDLAAGAIAGVQTIQNPITLARAVMERSPFVFLSGAGAEEFARGIGTIAFVEPDYFFTQERWRQLQALKSRAEVSLSEDNKFGTVGAVARDRAGHLASGTSTGGMTNKRYGRIGDCPVIGAGTWAEDATCAVSATGHGEFFIRLVAAHEIAARMRYAGETLATAANAVVHERLVSFGGAGGVIALTLTGQAALPCNTAGMYRGVITTTGELATAIYAEAASEGVPTGAPRGSGPCK